MGYEEDGGAYGARPPPLAAATPTCCAPLRVGVGVLAESPLSLDTVVSRSPSGALENAIFKGHFVDKAFHHQRSSLISLSEMAARG